jgi:hypothetical protein
MSGAAVAKLCGPDRSAKAIKDRVHNPGLVAIAEKGTRNVDILSDDHAAWDIRAMLEFEQACAQRLAHGRIDAGERPAVEQGTIDGWIKHELKLDNARDQRAEECRVSGKVGLAINFLTKPMGFEFRNGLQDVRTGHIHLIERLNGRKARRAPLVDRSHGCFMRLSH